MIGKNVVLNDSNVSIVSLAGSTRRPSLPIICETINVVVRPLVYRCGVTTSATVAAGSTSTTTHSTITAFTFCSDGRFRALADHFALLFGNCCHYVELEVISVRHIACLDGHILLEQAGYEMNIARQPI